jgi:hypothetical protein
MSLMIYGNLNHWMNTTRKTKRGRLVTISLVLAVLSLITYRVFFSPSTETLKVQTFRVSGGWGYQIFIHQKPYIYQPFIPAIPGKKPFPSRMTAFRAAKTVKAKLLRGERPDLTMEEILKTGVDSLGNPN